MKTADHAYKTLSTEVEQLKGGRRLHMETHLLAVRLSTSIHDSADDFTHAYNKERENCLFCQRHV